MKPHIHMDVPIAWAHIDQMQSGVLNNAPLQGISNLSYTWYSHTMLRGTSATTE